MARIHIEEFDFREMVRYGLNPYRYYHFFLFFPAYRGDEPGLYSDCKILTGDWIDVISKSFKVIFRGYIEGHKKNITFALAHATKFDALVLK